MKTPIVSVLIDQHKYVTRHKLTSKALLIFMRFMGVLDRLKVIDDEWD